MKVTIFGATGFSGQAILTEALKQGHEVTILVRQGKTWYQPTATEPSDGQALQETQTQAARFLRGL